MSFDRFRAQTLCEGFLGCSSFDDFFTTNFESLILNKENAHALKSILREDASDLFYKGILSLAEGLEGYKNRRYSWAIVKCYYSVFYMLRADLALRDYGLIRHRTIYYLEAKEGATPITKGRKGANRTNYSGDHKSAINYYIDLFGGTDVLLTQNIEGLTCYEWLMKKREQINYQERHFNEPDCPNFLTYIDEQVKNDNFGTFISEILDDKLIKAFQPEFAPLSIPIKRTFITRQNFINNSVPLNIPRKKIDYINTNCKFTIIDLTD